MCHSFDFSEKIDEIGPLWINRWYNTTTQMFVYTLLMCDSSSVVWGVPLIDAYDGYVWSKSTKLQSKPTFACQYRIANEDATVFFSNEGMVFLGAYTDGIFPAVPALISSVVHYDKFFGITNVNRNTLIYTSNLNLKQWADEESSEIEFLDNRGSFNKLIAFNDYVYLFREYGITKLSIYSSKNDFSFTHIYIYTSSSKIFENSVCVCGDKVFFVTRDGLYSFNGNSVSKVATKYEFIFESLQNDKCSSACLNGKYYLATKEKFEDENIGCEKDSYVNNVLLEIDIESFDLNIYRGVDVRQLIAVDNPYMSKLCACFYNENKQRVGELTFSGKTFESVNSKIWKSFNTDLGFQDKRKKIKKLVLKTKFDCLFKVKSDEDEKVVEIDGNDKEQTVNFSIYGKTFEFCFDSEVAECEICKPMVVFDVVS